MLVDDSGVVVGAPEEPEADKSLWAVHQPFSVSSCTWHHWLGMHSPLRAARGCMAGKLSGAVHAPCQGRFIAL